MSLVCSQEMDYIAPYAKKSVRLAPFFLQVLLNVRMNASVTSVRQNHVDLRLNGRYFQLVRHRRDFSCLKITFLYHCANIKALKHALQSWRMEVDCSPGMHHAMQAHVSSRLR